MGVPENLDQAVHVGKITKPHGIKGEVKILALSGEPEPFMVYRDVMLVDGQGQITRVALKKCRVQGRFAITLLDGITSRNQSEDLAGVQVWVDEAYLPELDESEFYWRDAMGRDVVSKDGQIIGRLINIFDAGGTDMMVVQTDLGEVLIPGQAEFIVEVSESGLVVDLPPGLLEVNLQD